MKLSVNEATLTGMCARNCATSQQVLVLKFAFGPRKATGPFEKPAPGSIQTLENDYAYRRTVNKKEGIDVPRIFVQAKFVKPV